MYKKILVGIDNSENALRAAKRALEYHKNEKSQVVAFHSIVHRLTELQPMTIGKATGTTLSYQIHQDQITLAKQTLEKVKKIFDDANASIETRLVDYKQPSDYIEEKVKDEGFDLVILGCKGEHSKIKRVIGTVPERVLNDAPCDVLIVR